MFMKPGLTNMEISGVTGIVDSGVSRYLKKLCDKGIAIRSDPAPGRRTYYLAPEVSKTVERLYWVLNTEGKAPALRPGNAGA